ncbi:MAG: phosphoribosylamine--glycine ligase [Rickettsiales bacterium]
MRVLLVGSGGREHALAWKIAQSPLCDALYVAPGNAGTHDIAENVEMDIQNHPLVIDFCRNRAVDLIVIGPEAPLAAGMSDALRAEGFAVFGAGKNAAQLETSKAFMKRACDEAGIITAAYRVFHSPGDARAYLDACDVFPVVVKADGLAQGKGVVIAETRQEAVAAVADMMEKCVFGPEAGKKIVIEEFLRGEEISFFAFVSGDKVVPIGAAQDHKRIGDGDVGPNTGGMGTYSPAPCCPKETERDVVRRFVRPVVAWLAERGFRYDGVIFAGLMLTPTGPVLLEYNVRFGDPETQSLMALMESDILPLLHKTALGELTESDAPVMKDGTAVCVVMAAKGYPGAYRKGDVIGGLGKAQKRPGVTVFHAGTLRGEKGETVSCGGRVLGVTAIGKDVRAARDAAYEAVADVEWEGAVYRRDVADRAFRHP